MRGWFYAALGLVFIGLSAHATAGAAPLAQPKPAVSTVSSVQEARWITRCHWRHRHHHWHHRRPVRVCRRVWVR
ncbi:MAG TPA: hypothetical protein VM689_01735 [Aliidongia sp.]|nr:hypothetical protein [Aliidongia sp.]